MEDEELNKKCHLLREFFSLNDWGTLESVNVMLNMSVNLLGMMKLPFPVFKNILVQIEKNAEKKWEELNLRLEDD